MQSFKERTISLQNLDEAAYPNNIGFEEMVKFYQIASNAEIARMENIIKNSDWDKFKALIQKVLGTKLK
jgi:hypothetical protein